MNELLNTIRAHIDQQYEGNREKARYDDYYRGMNDGLDKLEQFLDTLQEPEFPATDEEIETFLASHPKVEVPEKYKTPDWLYKELEQEPEVDGLEEEIKRYRKEEMPVVLESDLNDIARHFAEWGAEHLR